jgi:hypothetical protein
MSDFRELGYQLKNEWSKSIATYNKRLGADYDSKIDEGSGNRTSMIDGKPEITQVEARLHHLGKILDEVSIIVNYDTLSFDVVRPKSEIESFPSQSIDIPELVKQVITSLTESREGSR